MSIIKKKSIINITKDVNIEEDPVSSKDESVVKSVDMDGGGKVNSGDESLNENHDIYKSIILDEYISLTPTDLNLKIDDSILKKLRNKVEGKCIKPGYIMPNSVKIFIQKKNYN